MKRTLTKLVCTIFTILLILSVLPVVFAAESQPETVRITTSTISNPLYKETGKSTPKLYSRRLYSSGESYEEIAQACTEDYYEVVSALTQGMENREAEITLYFASKYPLYTDEETDGLDNDALSALISERWLTPLFEDSLAETDSPVQGDYLRWVWQQMACSFMGFYDANSGLYCYKTIYYMTYYTTKEQEDQLTKAVDAVLDNFGFTQQTTDHQKISVIYDYITDNVTYDYDNLDDDTYMLKHTAYAAMMNKTAVCQGYALLYYRMAEQCDVDTRVITGDGGGPHAWNISKLGDYYYNLDSTWDAGDTVYSYFLRGSSDFGNHTADPAHQTEAFRARYPIAPTLYKEGSTANPDDKNFTYTIVDDVAIITGYNGSAENVVVPGVLDGHPVRYIQETALNNKTFIKTLTLSEGIVGIAATTDYMTATTFAGCSNLKVLYLPTTFNFTYDKWGSNFFTGYTDIPQDCEKLERIEVAPNSPYLKSVDGIVYSQDGKYLVACPQNIQAEAIIIPDGVQEICSTAFAHNNNLQAIVLGKDVKTIGFEALMYCQKLFILQINEGLENILDYAFMESKALESLHLPASLSYLDDGAFDFSYFKAITVDEGNPTYRVENGGLLSDDQFVKYFQQPDVTSYTVPQGILSIADGAFSGSNLTSITLPEGLHSVGSYAFRDCANLEHIKIPDGTQYIYLGAFIGCDKLVSLILPADVNLKDRSYDGSTQNGLYLQKSCTIYTSNASGTAAESGYVNTEEFCLSNGFTMKPVSEFICQDGHKLVKTIIQDRPEFPERDYTYVYRCANTNCGCETQSFTAQYRNFFDENITLEFYETTYTGKEVRPAVTVVYDPDASISGDEITLVENVDYTLTYQDNINAGTAFACISGLGQYKGCESLIAFSIKPIRLEDLDIQLQYTVTDYDGTVKMPTVTVPGATEGVDYDLLYYNHECPGQATVVISAITDSNYTGYVEKHYTILPAKEPAVENLAATMVNYNALQLQWIADWKNPFVGQWGFRIYMKELSAEQYTFLAYTDNYNYLIPDLKPGTQYNFKVVKWQTYNGFDFPESEAAVITITTECPLEKPLAVQATLEGKDTAYISWTADPNAHGYVVYMRCDGSDWMSVGQTDQCSYTVCPLPEDTLCEFKVLPYQVYNYEQYIFEEFVIVSVQTPKATCEHTYINDCDESCETCGDIRPVTHSYANATCTDPKTCTVCGATEGDALGHDFADATCTAPKTCKVCGATEGEALGHKFDILKYNEDEHWRECACGTEEFDYRFGHGYSRVSDADNHWLVCECGVIIDLEPHTFAPKSDDTHHWTQCWCEEATQKIAHESDGGTVTKKATCTATGTKTYKCKHCGKVLKTETISKTAHKYTGKTCGKATKCSGCGKTGSKLAHSYSNDCDTKCNRCSKTRTITHKYSSATCTKAKTCKVCGKTSGSKLGHKYTNDCDTSCNRCGKTRTIKHQYKSATCTKPKTCKECGKTSGSKLGHKYTNDCDTSCNRCSKKRSITHDYKTKTTKATTSKNGKVVKKCAECGKISSEKTIYRIKSFSLSTTKYTYSGATRTPSVTVKDYKGKKLTKDTDYTVAYESGRADVGEYTVTVTLKGNYTGTKKLYFTIVPKAPSISSLSAKSKALDVKLNPQTEQTSGYQIEYSTSKSFKSSKKITISDINTEMTTIKSLKAKTTYYVRIRAYKTVDGEKLYSSWSSYQYKKTK
ncbi:MAG: leucine-rich repeat protein [Oscillospiraceae bacterium]|nr:leucine-rich repeat protein [Oscillospiraceae bacterium]